MQRQIEFNLEAGQIEVTFHGPVSFLDRIETMDIVVPRIADGGFKRVLIDYTHAWVDESSVESFEILSARLSAETRLRGLRVALVNPPEFHAVPTEDVAAKSGFQVRRFSTRATAISWLGRARAQTVPPG